MSFSIIYQPLPQLTRSITEICDLDPLNRYCGVDYFSMFNTTGMQDAYDVSFVNYVNNIPFVAILEL